ncbi:hypothetical protein C2G38_2233517 [Gigaspora rosea]|uniref:Uncharacterized protein n=1 Tax=Gigaspora rosea TaxID=44941 RepID=A0A397TUT5_9GLOM|nr:hypothetical protein C2G38_2233517 [Gigaspora rosea]
MKFITVLVVINLSVYLINALPANLIKDQETTIVPHEHHEHESVEHKKLEKRSITYGSIENSPIIQIIPFLPINFFVQCIDIW